MRLVEGAAPAIASWPEPLTDPNLEDAHIPHALPWLGIVPPLEAFYRKRLRHKCWQYMTVSSGDVFLAFIIGTAGFAGNGFVYMVEGERVVKRFAITPLAAGVHLAPSSTAGQHRFAGSKLNIAVDNGGHDFAARIDCPELRASLDFVGDGEHLAICVPLPGGRWNYTHKYGAFAVTGHIEIDGRRIAIDGAGTLDFTKMYAPRHTVWKWIAVAGRSRSGKLVGVNLVDPTPNAPHSENAAWIDGKKHALRNVSIGDGTARADDVEADVEAARRDRPGARPAAAAAPPRARRVDVLRQAARRIDQRPPRRRRGQRHLVVRDGVPFVKFAPVTLRSC